MARTRSQPISPGGFKSLEDIPRKRRITRSTANTAGAANAPITASARGESPPTRVTKNTTKSTTNAINKRGTKKTARATKSASSKKEEPVANAENDVNEPTGQPASKPPATTQSPASEPTAASTKSEQHIFSSQVINIGRSQNASLALPVHPSGAPSARRAGTSLDNPPRRVLGVASPNIVTPAREQYAVPGAKVLKPHAQIPPFKDHGSPSIISSLSSQKAQVKFRSSVGQAGTHDTHFNSTGRGIKPSSQAGVQQLDPDSQLSSELRQHTSKTAPDTTAASSQVSTQEPSVPFQAISANSRPVRGQQPGLQSKVDLVNPPLVHMHEPNKLSQCPSQSSRHEPDSGDPAASCSPATPQEQPQPTSQPTPPCEPTPAAVAAEGSRQSISQPTFRQAAPTVASVERPHSSSCHATVRRPTPVVIFAEGPPQPRPLVRHGGPTPLLRFAVLAQAQTHLGAPASLIQHELASRSNARRSSGREAQAANSPQAVPTSPPRPVKPGVTTGIRAIGSRIPSRSNPSGDPMALDSPPKTNSVATQTSPMEPATWSTTASIATQTPPMESAPPMGASPFPETPSVTTKGSDRTCHCCSAILQCPNGHFPWLQSKVREYMPNKTLTQPESVIPMNRKRSRTEETPEEDTELPSSKRRELRAATLACHRDRKIIPIAQRRSRRMAQKKTCIGVPLFTDPQPADGNESPESPHRFVKVHRHPSSIANDNNSKTESSTEAQPAPSTPSRGWGIRGLLSSVPRSIQRLMSSFGEQENQEPTTPTPALPPTLTEPAPSAETPVSNAEPVSNSVPHVSDAVITELSAPDVEPVMTAGSPISDAVTTEGSTHTGQEPAEPPKPMEPIKSIELTEASRPKPKSLPRDLSSSLVSRPRDRSLVFGARKVEVPFGDKPQVSHSLLPAAKRDKDAAAPVVKPKKRKRSPSPDVIPNPPGVSYGMDLKYFCYSSESEEEEEEPPQTKPPKPLPPRGILRERKRVRFDVSPQDTPSKLRLQRTMAIADMTPSRAPITPSRLSREVHAAEQTAPSPGAAPASHGSADALSHALGRPPTRVSAPPVITNTTGTYKLDYNLFSSDEEDVEEEAAPPAKTTVPADTFVLRWPAANPYSPISGGGRGEAAGSGLFGREFGPLRGALVA
ncbi:hypothetical protein CPC735_007470 [Coccidioides posadasii C735 delta SOWgp]|uniref:Uncharacterized protein n=1 Tax=Coccidioides posadasii (strain C735) TaxID=222929 RepID=C5PA12_COCP7|nr:hypothetical protein CPC735_007470 [Coccidioides posadasii C735 delta SOWgp]EER26574.1 hypothetical protein CPC735_007470 [Coccidioides posadasii C735 delta SOWgp]|eukprot:XP_003068719.1 hypothetical protein CPC735_007470 [Coccidioides posadasii C735 delta SOWgp]